MQMTKTLNLSCYMRMAQIILSHGGDSSFPIYEKDSQSVEIYNQNDIDYYIFTNLASLVSVWSKDHTEYSVSTTLSLPALKEIIDSVFEEVIEQ